MCSGLFACGFAHGRGGRWRPGISPCSRIWQRGFPLTGGVCAPKWDLRGGADDRGACFVGRMSASLLSDSSFLRNELPCAGWHIVRQAEQCAEESPDSTRRRCRVTPGRGNPRESATEKKPPLSAGARVKRWGKSPPRDGQPDRHGKPHREQCRIGIARGVRPAGRLGPADPGRQLEARR